MSCHVVSYHVILRNDYGMLFGWLCNVFGMIMAYFWDDFLGMTFAMFVASATSSWQVVTSRYDKSSWQVVVTSRYDKSSWQVVVTWQFDVTNWDGLGMACHIISYHSVISQYVISNHSSMSCHVMSCRIISCHIAECLWDDFWMIMGWFWVDYGMIMGRLWVDYGLIMGCFLDDYATFLGWWWHGFGMIFGDDFCNVCCKRHLFVTSRDKSLWQVVVTSRRDVTIWRDQLGWSWNGMSYHIVSQRHITICNIKSW